ncbi:pyrroline-5-carboxylate reductase [Niallia sp. 01092]|uniref:pyrroline-5-carboxylate reductase n=1 Tax=unclassified Niallia TaxID=2837522 RepID=UPI003FD56757
MTKLTFIGAGSMCEAIISGIVNSKMINGEDIFVTNRANQERLETLQNQYGVNYSYNMETLSANADAIILAMKPKDVKEAITEIKPFLADNTLLISVLAGVSIKSMELLADKALPIARAMPNTSATVGKSATGIAMNAYVNENQKQFVLKIFETIGLSTVVEESQLDAVTGLSGSGPAYIYYIVEAMEKSAVEIGLDHQIAKELIVQTLNGAAEMIATSSKTPAELRKNVTSPGGTTEAGIKVLDSFNVQNAFIQCIQEAAAKSKQLGNTLSEELKITN